MMLWKPGSHIAMCRGCVGLGKGTSLPEPSLQVSQILEIALVVEWHAFPVLDKPEVFQEIRMISDIGGGPYPLFPRPLQRPPTPIGVQTASEVHKAPQSLVLAVIGQYSFNKALFPCCSLTNKPGLPPSQLIVDHPGLAFCTLLEKAASGQIK